MQINDNFLRHWLSALAITTTGCRPALSQGPCSSLGCIVALRTNQGGGKLTLPGIILCMRPVNERRRYNVTSSLTGWARTQNDPWLLLATTIKQKLAYMGCKFQCEWCITDTWHNRNIEMLQEHSDGVCVFIQKEWLLRAWASPDWVVQSLFCCAIQAVTSTFLSKTLIKKLLISTSYIFALMFTKNLGLQEQFLVQPKWYFPLNAWLNPSKNVPKAVMYNHICSKYIT